MSEEQAEHLATQAPQPPLSHSLSEPPATNTTLEHAKPEEEVGATLRSSARMPESHDANTSTTLEGVSATMVNLAEQTLVEEESKKTQSGHKSDPSTSSLSLPPSKDDDAQKKRSLDQVVSTTTMPTTPTTWDPLNSTEPREEEEGDRTHGQDRTIIVEEGDDVVDSNGKLIYPDDDDDEEEERKPVQRRTSHLRLDLKPHSPLPWEQVNPPLDNNLKAIAGYYSPVTSHKFRTLQSSGGPRPLIPKSSYYFGPPPPDSAYGTRPVGQIGVHHPREILRVERDYTGGELIIQFAPIYPLELEGRITPTHFLESINSINELLISAHSLKRSLFDNLVSILSLQVSRLFLKTHFEKEMMRLRKLIDKLNAELYNPVGLNMLWPGSVAFLYLEIEYY